MDECLWKTVERVEARKRMRERSGQGKRGLLWDERKVDDQREEDARKYCVCFDSPFEKLPTSHL